METLATDNLKQKIEKKKKESLIFLVDDNPIYLNILKNDLASLPKTKVMTFSTGEECLEHMYLEPSLIVLDYDLRGNNTKIMNGIEVLRHIKKINEEAEVVILSGCEDVAVATASMKFGAFDYVVKNENALLNIKNKITNIFRKFRIMQRLKDERKAKWVITGALCLIALFAFVYNSMMVTL